MRLPQLRFTMRWMLGAVAVSALIIYLILPLSAPDRRMMATYEWLGDTSAKPGLTLEQVIRQIGPPSSQTIPANPKEAAGYEWVAEFKSALEYHRFRLSLSIDRKHNDQVVGWGLFRTEHQGLGAILVRIFGSGE